jgi:hypothetical protein
MRKERIESTANPEKQKRQQKDEQSFEPKSIFHNIEFDVSCKMTIPPVDQRQNYIPKKWVHTFQGHSKGV